jgi:hypothetical protein
MAIDFGRMARGVATGYLSAKIANTEANDRLKEDILRKTGENFYNNTLPEFQKKETNRRDTYNKLKSRFNPEIAEYMDQSGFITGAATDYDDIITMLSENNNFNEAKLKAYLEAKQAGTYGERAEKRFKSIQDQENFIMNNMTKNGFGTNTIKNQLGLGLTKEEPMKAEAPAMEGEMPAAPAPTTTTDTTTTKLPTFEEIFGDTTKSAVDAFISLSAEDKTRIIDDADREFKNLFINPVSGSLQNIPEGYRNDYDKLSDEEKKQKSFFVYVKDRHFQEQFLPKMYGITYEPKAVMDARNAINYQRSIGNDEGVSEAKNILRSLGYDPADYNL